MNVGIYTRVSTDQQVQGESLADQEHDARAWSEANGHAVVATYSDPGLSGRLPAPERPGLADALEALASGAIDALVLRDLDRLARELTVQEAVLAQVWSRPDTCVYEYAAGREVLRDDPDDPMRTAMRQVQGVFAQLERALIAKRLRDARRNKARRGRHANGPAPYGWRTQDGELFPVPDELAVLDLIRQHKSSGATQVEIAAALNDAGLLTRDGARWTQQVVSRILRRDNRTPEQIAYQQERIAAVGA
jgi:DNA invertase Pin-like site-specific DNA recombinase